jgi:hypothetical protein
MRTLGLFRPRLRLLMRSVFVILALFLSFYPLPLHAQVDCVYPGHVTVANVRGRVFDPLGALVPGVVITLVDEHNQKLQTTTDAAGRFHIDTSPGNYSFEAVSPPLQTSQTNLSVGKDLIGLVRPSDLHVILGLNGSYCAWVTTSRKELNQIITGNEKRSQESVQKYATQK